MHVGLAESAASTWPYGQGSFPSPGNAGDPGATAGEGDHILGGDDTGAPFHGRDAGLGARPARLADTAAAMTVLRLSKAALAAAIGFTCTLVVIGNVFDPDANLTFLRHVMAMDTLPPGAAIRDRAVTAGGLQNAAFGAIVAAEALTALLCWVGALRMALASAGPPARFAAAKAPALAGLTLGFLLWQAGFLGIGGEWFAMWMSKEWNAQAEAFRFAVTLLGVLIYVALPEGEP